MSIALLGSSLCIMAAYGAAPGKIVYVPDPGAWWLQGFPENGPATLDDVVAADRAQGHNTVRYAASNDTYYVDADLWVGDHRHLGTFFQIGRPGHPRETLVIKGTVWVRPPQDSPLRSDGRRCIINRLTLGRREQSQIQPTLKIHCDAPGKHGLYLGHRQGTKITEGGALHVYHGTITAAIQDADHLWGNRDYVFRSEQEKALPYAWSAPGWYATDVQLENAVVSWFQGSVTYGLQLGRGPLFRFEDCVFEHGGAAVRNGRQYLRGCTFRHMQTPIAEGGSLDAKAVQCTFENNRHNWSLGSGCARGIVLLDCEMNSPLDGYAIKRNRDAPFFPACRVRHSVVLQVRGRQGRPVRGAVAVIHNDDHPEEITRGAAMTDAHGMTPSDPETDAMVVTTKRIQATGTPGKPDITTYDYRVHITKEGMQPHDVCIRGAHPIERPLRVTLLPQQP